MELSLKTAIEDAGFSAVSRESGIPVSTIFRWVKDGAIPGTGATLEWRISQLKQAIERLEAAQRAA